MFKSSLTITMGLLLSILLMTLLGHFQDGKPILGGFIDAHSEEAEALYTLYEDYCESGKPKLACVALNRAIYAQVDEQEKTRWEKEFGTARCDSLTRRLFSTENRHQG